MSFVFLNKKMSIKLLFLFKIKDSSGFITIIGENGETGKRPLKKGFDAGKSDKFNIECLDLGEIKRVHIEHDNSSFTKKVHIFLSFIFV